MLFFFNDTATTEIYTLSLHDALPICGRGEYVRGGSETRPTPRHPFFVGRDARPGERRDGEQGFEPEVSRHGWLRSEEHTSELQSRQYLVCPLLLVKKKNNHCC